MFGYLTWMKGINIVCYLVCMKRQMKEIQSLKTTNIPCHGYGSGLDLRHGSCHGLIHGYIHESDHGSGHYRDVGRSWVGPWFDSRFEEWLTTLVGSWVRSWVSSWIKSWVVLWRESWAESWIAIGQVMVEDIGHVLRGIMDWGMGRVMGSSWLRSWLSRFISWLLVWFMCYYEGMKNTSYSFHPNLVFFSFLQGM